MKITPNGFIAFSENVPPELNGFEFKCVQDNELAELIGQSNTQITKGLNIYDCLYNTLNHLQRSW